MDPASPTFILNRKSARIDAARAEIARVSDELGVEAAVIITRRGDDVSSLGARAAGEARGPVVAGGGDETVSAVAGAVAGTETALGVLPMGTLNHFAKEAGIPLNFEAAVRNAFSGRCAVVDVGEVNGRVFVNNSGIGLYPRFVRLREEEEHQGHAKPVAFLLALRSLVRRDFRLRIKVGHKETLDHLTPFLFVGANRYQISGLEIGTRPCLDSGRLWVCTAPTIGRGWEFVRVALKTLLGRETDKTLNAFEAEELWVETGTARVNVSTDGEVSMMEAPLRYRIRPRALGVVAPSEPS